MQDNSALGRALAMVRDSRCPRDRVQTRETLRPYLVEEVLELDHALGEAEPEAIRAEVSDLLLHLAFQLVIAEERGEFTPDEVAEVLERKMRRRHPHLFDLGDAEPWERIKGASGRGRPFPVSSHLAAAAQGVPTAGAGRFGGVRLARCRRPAGERREEVAEVERELESRCPGGAAHG